jgi:small subunit ribosomal protein S20
MSTSPKTPCGLVVSSDAAVSRCGAPLEVHAADSVSAAASHTCRIAPPRPADPGPLVDSPARMANIKSQKKRNIQNEKRHRRNIATKSALKTSSKRVHAAAAAGDAETAVAEQRAAARSLDKAASKGVLHKRTVARRKSRLAKTAAAAAG